MEKPGDGHDEDAPNFKPTPEDGRRMIEAAFEEDEEKRQQVTAAFYRALGDLTLFCMEHEDMCDHHVVDLRDAILTRVGMLAYRVAAGVKLYRESREFGIQEPVEVVEKIYKDWQELMLLYGCREPQDRLEWKLVEVVVEEEE
jgi:hypothetical protein